MKLRVHTVTQKQQEQLRVQTSQQKNSIAFFLQEFRRAPLMIFTEHCS